MDPGRRGSLFRLFFWLVIFWTLCAAVYLAVRLDVLASRPPLLLLVVGAVLLTFAGLFGWNRDRLAAEAERKSLSESLDPMRAAAERVGPLEAENQELERRAQGLEEELSSQRDRARRLERAGEVQRDWTRSLRLRVQKLRAERGPLGRSDDLPSLVLEVAMNLVSAEKGLLLHRDETSGGLSTAASRGFENDPKDSRIAHRFADRVIEREEIIRENEPQQGEGAASAADQEIENLIAIPIFIADEFSGSVVCANSDDGFSHHDEEVLLALGDHAGAVLENGKLHGDLRASYLATVRMLADVIEAKDALLRGHCEEVSRHVGAVAERLGFDVRQREELVFGSLLHDVGKIGISEGILMKPDRLNAEEYNVVKLHPRIGYRLIQHLPALESVAEGILYHHERWDGGGYPTGLRGEEIPVTARVICIADSFSAMTADRPYRGRVSVEEACTELERCAGTQFDPNIVKVFVQEVRGDPPGERANLLTIALDDPEVDVRRDSDELVGQSAIALTDNVTLLYSHRYFHEALAAEIARAEVQGSSFSLVLARIEDLGRINETQGYAAGDEALRRCAEVIVDAARECAGIASRYSGRRFAILCPGEDASVAERAAARVQEELGESPRALTGVASWSPGDAAEDVIGRALAGVTGKAGTT